MTNCVHCGGRLMWEREDARDPLVLKCQACARPVGPPRPHEEPAKYEGITPSELRAIDSDEYIERGNAWQREHYRKKQGAAA